MRQADTISRGVLRELCLSLGLSGSDVVHIEIDRYMVTATVLCRDSEGRLIPAGPSKEDYPTFRVRYQVYLVVGDEES